MPKKTTFSDIDPDKDSEILDKANIPIGAPVVKGDVTHPLTPAQLQYLALIINPATEKTIAENAMNFFGFETPLNPPTSYELASQGISLPMASTVIDAAALSFNKDRFIYAIKQDTARYNGAVAKLSSPLCVLAGRGQKAALALFDDVIAAGFDVNDRQFQWNEAFLKRIKMRAEHPGESYVFEPPTALEKACDRLFVGAVEKLLQMGAEKGRALDIMRRFDEEYSSIKQKKIDEINKLLSKVVT
ncbi:hypothetical protein GLAREA_07756 [Glarea lozoyensis ATCC 20868]|uniref:Uncharacterized protein n=1 Tax=Glarea lozoyensis (strain ATCC 20868 / MF5171) TaxID=1116229 RepID=S3D255_GLAL2|nr:uncharacterized protein GLAREA_07756 [Glarea lozoyensis ATCC 20868]EPE32622.1 hypothetical protein GLAREA_07756 [Glarea lozoyensis ATCC 20868]